MSDLLVHVELPENLRRVQQMLVLKYPVGYQQWAAPSGMSDLLLAVPGQERQI